MDFKSYIPKALRTESKVCVMIARPTEDGTFRYPTLKEGEANALKLGRLLHAVIGKVTEAAEALDNLKKHIFYGKPIDEVNLIEEQGDGHWYDAILYDALGADPEETLQKNIAKLMVRYPHKFESEQALTRDLEAERKTLEETKTIWEARSDENKQDSEHLLQLLKMAGAELCSNKCESVKSEDRPWKHCPECKELTAAIANLQERKTLETPSSTVAEQLNKSLWPKDTGCLTEEVERLRSDLRDRNDILAEIRSVIRMTGPSIEVNKYARIVEILRNHGQLS